MNVFVFVADVAGILDELFPIYSISRIVPIATEKIKNKPRKKRPNPGLLKSAVFCFTTTGVRVFLQLFPPDSTISVTRTERKHQPFPSMDLQEMSIAVLFCRFYPRETQCH